MNSRLYGNIIQYDKVSGDVVRPEFILAKRSGQKLGVIENVEDNITIKTQMNNPSEISMTVHRYMDGRECSLWDKLKDFRLIYDRQHDVWYDIRVDLTEAKGDTKEITGTQAQQAELSNFMMYDVDINTEDDIDQDDYVSSVFYDPDNADGSILNRILADKAEHFSIYHVDESLMKLWRQFSFDNVSVYDALMDVAEEIDCLFVFGEHEENDGKLHRTISAYDLEDYCPVCGKRGIYSAGQCTNCGNTEGIVYGYGDDTGVFISVENLAPEVNYTSNADQVKNCFRLVAGDDYVTDTIRNCNPNGSNYLWYFTEDMKEDMSEELVAALDAYNKLYDEYNETREMSGVPEEAVIQYNALVDISNKYHDGDIAKADYPIVGFSKLIDLYYNSMTLRDFLKITMAPASRDTVDTSAEVQMENLLSNLKSFSYRLGIDRDPSEEKTANSAMTTTIQNYFKAFVDTSRYRVKATMTSRDGAEWSGTIEITSYTKDKDTITQKFPDDESGIPALTFYEDDDDFTRRMIEIAMHKVDVEDLGASALFKKDTEDFKKAIMPDGRHSRYALNYLTNYMQMAEAALTVMEPLKYSKESDDMHEELYVPYWEKWNFLNEAIVVRDNEIKELESLLDYIEKEKAGVREALNLKKYLDDLWAEFCSFRRDDEYSNENYFATDDSTDSFVVGRAMEFIEVATKELVKSATLQHTISCKLNDLLVMPEFQSVLEKFGVGNWIRIKADGKVHKLRLLDYSLSYDKLSDIEVNFSDMVFGYGTMSDIMSIISSAKSMSTSYSSTKRQASRGDEAQSQLDTYVNDGLAITSKIVNDAENQGVTYDSQGLLLRKASDYDTGVFEDEQIKIINNGLYYTRDNWKTVSTGVGKFYYKDPFNNYEETEGYGVIADTIVGNLILGAELGIFSENGSFVVDENGQVTITADAAASADLPDTVFTVKVKNSEGKETDYIKVYKKDGSDEYSVYIAGSSVFLEDDESVEAAMTRLSDQIAEAVSSFEAHVADKDNPHEVTAAQVGLGNVENKSSTEILGEMTYDNVVDALGYVPASQSGSVTMQYETVSCSLSDTSSRVSIPSTYASTTDVLTITAPISGYVYVTGYVVMTSNSEKNRHAEISISDSGGTGFHVYNQMSIAALTTNNSILTCSAVAPITAGEIIHLAAWQNSGSRLYAGGELNALFIAN